MLRYIGCPLFAVTIHYAPRTGHLLQNPTDRTIHAERSSAGEMLVWIGRLALAIEPRRLRPPTPLLVIE